jgi:long-chain acyl-CoA synthetase
MQLHVNLFDLQAIQANVRPNEPAIAHKKNGVWEKLAWKEYLRQSQACAAALIDARIGPGDRVVLLSENRPEWLVADMGILTAGAVTVPIHATLHREQVEFQVRNTQASWLFASTREQLEKILPFHKELPHLRGITVFDNGAGAEAIPWERWQGVNPQQHRAELEARQKHVGPESLATILFTSGTTGRPRGVVLTHGNVLSSVRALYERFPLGSNTSTLTWLPLGHIAARSVEHFMILLTGGVMWIAESPEKLLHNLAEVSKESGGSAPTNLSGVPRLYEKVLAALQALPPAERRPRLRALFGPRVSWVTCGSAPLREAVVEEFREAGLPLLEGYGLTEASGVLTCNSPEEWQVGTVGKPLPGVELKTAPDGEILVRGACVMAGYWNDPEHTAKVIRDGWLHTGDLGSIDDQGYVRITGRKKDLMVLSNGQKVIATEVETLLAADPLIDQILVYGEGRSFLVAVVVPRKEIRERLASAGENSPFGADVLRQLSENIQEALECLPPEMRVRRFLVRRNEFSVTAGEITDTLKPRRNEIFTTHKEALDRLYEIPRSEDALPLAQLV